MKRVLLLLSLVASVWLHGAVSDVKIPQQSLASPPTWKDVIWSPTANSLVGFDGSKVIGGVTVGNGLQLASGTLTATGSGSGTVTNNGTLTAGLPVLGDGTTVIKVGAINLAGGSSYVSGLLPVANGGSGTATPAIVAGSNITVSGTWPNQTINSTASGSGSVTSVNVTTANGVSATGGPITTSGSFTFSLGAIAPTSVNGVTFSGASSPSLSVTGSSSVSGANTGDQTITLTGDVTGAGTAGIVTTLATSGVTAAQYGSATASPQITFDAKGRATAAANVTITPAVGSITGLGTNVATALGVAVGSAGGPVVNGGVLGTPSSGNGSNITNVNASTVTTNANLTGPVTSVGNATSIAAGVVTDTMLATAVKPAVAVVATANLTLSGEQTIDGTLTSGSLVLATGQSTGAQNGPWVSAAGAWARPTWYTSGSTTQAQQFLTTFVRLGTLYQGSTWRMTTAAVTIDTTATTWTQTPMVASAASITNGVTGTGAVVLATSPTLSTPALGTIASGNGAALTALTAANMTAGTFSGAFTTTSWIENTPVITGGLTASGSGANTFAGSTGTFLTSTGAVTIGPGAVGVTGITTFTPPVRTSGVASYLTITPPADTGQTAATESIGINVAAATRTWADGTTALQRERVFGAPTYNKTTTSATFTRAINVDIPTPIAGTGVTFTDAFGLRAGSAVIVDSGAATTPAVVKVTGVPFAGTGTTSFPLVYINDANATASTTLNTAGTYLGVNGDGTQDLANFLKDGTSQFKVSSVGAVTATGTINSGGEVQGASGLRSGSTTIIYWQSRSILNSPADGLINAVDSSGLNFGRVIFGRQTAINSAAAIGFDAVNGFTLQSGAGTATWNDGSTAASGTVANRYLFGIAAPTLTATNAITADTVASTVYIGGAPIAGSNNPITTAYALNVAAGNTLLGGTLAVGGGAALIKFLTATATLDYGSILAAGNEDKTITVTGATAGDSVIFGLPATVLAGAVFNAWVSAADTVTIRCNNAGSLAIDPASATYRALVLRF